MIRTPNEVELEALVRWIVRGYVEIRAGQRSALTLRGLVAPKLFRRIRRASTGAARHPVRSGDLGGAMVTRLGYDRVYGVVAVRELEERWDVIMIELRRTQKGTWQVTDLGPLRERVATGLKR